VQTGAPFDRLPADLYQFRLKFDQQLIDAVPSQVPIDIVAGVSEGQRSALAPLPRGARAEVHLKIPR
jgi:hypothetical protein